MLHFLSDYKLNDLLFGIKGTNLLQNLIFMYFKHSPLPQSLFFWLSFYEKGHSRFFLKVSNFIIPVLLQPGGLNLWYFKFRLFDPTEQNPLWIKNLKLYYSYERISIITIAFRALRSYLTISNFNCCSIWEHLLFVKDKTMKKKFADSIVFFSWIFKILRNLSIHKPILESCGCPTKKKSGPISSTVLTFISYKQTEKQTRKV